ncbi:1-phosphofructokinase family hexose kinase [Cellulomonas fimi]|uniref:PfkB domain protein n=1 Tax=Cellulomonas fimi (strain ATCC 484 / DSM 20113 / JCM 1341 / CCUG 24087 / LMG 16345 / NBRC 15513 / NCIMB 8980 / NCTC 7547 / NRS-133) TaxID=590998 RepID=F4GZW2_CELFA|nr:PfkB family carbohydrate kinase [Cellulomonas fimi]AEE47278.1 PfkB domain protein [Cellulomonas fimi ATCC 484]NNH06992.1 phosphofructokinase [Cellulomonas fimi]VEH35791.1 Putative phosphofructokinase pfkB [Cellulomonas fimi]
MPDRSASDEPRTPRVCVLAPTPLLTVTIEPPTSEESHPEVHVHAGGQGLWVGRMAVSLGADVVVCGPFGGETGTVLAHLAEVERLRVRPTAYAGGNGAYVHDRRDGDRREVAETPPHPLDRHELDDLYGTVLVEAMDADVTVLTGADPARILPAAVVGRLARDLRAAGRTVVADLSGRAAAAFAQAGGAVLKISHEELVDGGFVASDSLDDLRGAALRFVEQGLDAVVVSRAGEPVLIVTAGETHEVVPPPITVVDHRGAGDSMTAGIAVGLGRGLTLAEAVRLGAAAGALNVTRRGLGTGRREQIERFARRVQVRPADGGAGS